MVPFLNGDDNGNIHFLVIVYRARDGRVRTADYTAASYEIAEGLACDFTKAFPGCKLLSVTITLFRTHPPLQP